VRSSEIAQIRLGLGAMVAGKNGHHTASPGTFPAFKADLLIFVVRQKARRGRLRAEEPSIGRPTAVEDEAVED
jgi:hypothetical protein